MIFIVCYMWDAFYGIFEINSVFDTSEKAKAYIQDQIEWKQSYYFVVEKELNTCMPQ